MTFQILDVGHGFCAQVVADNGNVMLFDCGHKSYPEFRPSAHLMANGCTGVERFFVTNYDEDHISDLPHLRALLPVRTLHCNRSISTGQLRALKRQAGPTSEAMESLLQMIDYYSGSEQAPVLDFPDITWSSFCNSYGAEFLDTNNLSLVTFLACRGLRVIIPGDLEEAGWKKLLGNARFSEHLNQVNVFIAPHHGRESGYCREVFKICRPAIVVFSDSAVKYATQEMTNTYANHATGIQFNDEERRVLTTRKDGTLTWTL